MKQVIVIISIIILLISGCSSSGTEKSIDVVNHQELIQSLKPNFVFDLDVILQNDTINDEICEITIKNKIIYFRLEEDEFGFYKYNLENKQLNKIEGLYDLWLKYDKRLEKMYPFLRDEYRYPRVYMYNGLNDVGFLFVYDSYINYRDYNFPDYFYMFIEIDNIGSFKDVKYFKNVIFNHALDVKFTGVKSYTKENGTYIFDMNFMKSNNVPINQCLNDFDNNDFKMGLIIDQCNGKNYVTSYDWDSRFVSILNSNCDTLLKYKFEVEGKWYVFDIKVYDNTLYYLERGTDNSGAIKNLLTKVNLQTNEKKTYQLVSNKIIQSIYPQKDGIYCLTSENVDNIYPQQILSFVLK